MKPIDYNVFPYWKFMQESFSWEQAFEYFGPYAGAKVKMRKLDKYTIESYMELVVTNTNYVGTHFGGSLYSMCDPFFMFLLMENLGPDYIVWDKSASIDFIKPGLGTVTARFHIPQEEIDLVRKIVAEKRKTDREYTCEVWDEDQKIVAKINKVLYIRRKPKV